MGRKSKNKPRAKKDFVLSDYPMSCVGGESETSIEVLNDDMRRSRPEETSTESMQHMNIADQHRQEVVISKRSRKHAHLYENTSVVALESECESDCYNEVVNQKEGLGRVRNSWLRCGLEYISYRGDANDGPESIGAANTELLGQKSPEWKSDMEKEIHGLKRQLLQIKKRLWPAAIDASKQKGGDVTPNRIFEEARRVCNPFEVLGEGKAGGLNRVFTNRSAVKLANMNCLLGFCLTPTTTFSSNNKCFKFVDLCGAPGGFSEYLLDRCHSSAISAHGWGLSLLGENDDGCGTGWKLEHMITRDGGSSAQYRASEGADGTGDIYRWQNIEALKLEILKDSQYLQTPGDTVDLVVADGGFDAQRNNDRQEEITFRIVVCQVAAALLCLRSGGNFVIKIFGTYSTPMRIMLEFLFEQFKEIGIVKPILSRPASAERYIVCRGFKCSLPKEDLIMWRDSMLDAPYSITRDTKIYTCLESYLLRSERDILLLNIRACFSILSCIQRGHLAFVHNHNVSFQRKAKKKREKPQVDIRQYRKAWQIATK